MAPLQICMYIYTTRKYVWKRENGMTKNFFLCAQAYHATYKKTVAINLLKASSLQQAIPTTDNGTFRGTCISTSEYSFSLLLTEKNLVSATSIKQNLHVRGAIEDAGNNINISGWDDTNKKSTFSHQIGDVGRQESFSN